MKIDFTEDELIEINNAAVQKLAHREVEKAIHARMDQIAEDVGDNDIGMQALIDRFIIQKRVAVPQKKLLVPEVK